jgi:putative membrane protein
MNEPMEAFQLLDPDWVRALHIIAVIAWISGLVMLPRLYVYQTQSTPGGELDQKMTEAAARLRKLILTPAMLLVWVFGLAVLAASNFIHLKLGWFHLKLLLVLALSAYHGFLAMEGKKLARGERRRSEKFWRLANEVPFVIAIVVVILAVVEPF